MALAAKMEYLKDNDPISRIQRSKSCMTLVNRLPEYLGNMKSSSEKFFLIISESLDD